MSRTLRETQRKVTPPYQKSAPGASEMRPRAGLRPTRPEWQAGVRMEPPPSLASASGSTRAATAAAEPPEEPPGVRVVSQGLTVAPYILGSVESAQPASGELDFPSSTKPACLMRRTRSQSADDTMSLK